VAVVVEEQETEPDQDDLEQQDIMLQAPWI
jgi:hypothetical protein